MRRAGIITKKDDYEYIDRFIDFLERIINIIVSVFERLGGISLGKKTGTDAKTPT